MNDWQLNKSWQHWFQHSIFPILIVLLFLAIPKSWLVENQHADATRTILIELSSPTIKPESHKQPIKKPQIPKPVKQPTQERLDIKKSSTQQSTPVTKQRQSQPKEKRIQKKEITINSSDVQIMMSKVIDPKIIDDDFSAKKNNNQFMAKQYTVPDKYADLPYFDESIDAPRVQMEFYSEGFMGSIERFFDKITFEKTFTTKYGTKIQCALVGVIAMCGWK